MCSAGNRKEQVMSSKISCMVLVLAVLLVAAMCPGQNAAAKSSIESVTLYRGQALVTRAVALPAPDGPGYLWPAG